MKELEVCELSVLHHVPSVLFEIGEQMSCVVYVKIYPTQHGVYIGRAYLVFIYVYHYDYQCFIWGRGWENPEYDSQIKP